MGKIWYVSPSNQGANVGINGYGTEHEQMYLLAEEILPHLDRAGVSFVLADRNASLSKRVQESNDLGAGFHFCLHSNAGGGGMAYGPVALYYSDAGKVFGEQLVSALLELGQKNNRSYNVKQATGLYELRKSIAPACLLEVDFHDSATGVDFLTTRRKEIGEAIARCIIEADGKAFVPETVGECADRCVSWGLLEPGNWEQPMTKEEIAVLLVRLKTFLEQGGMK